MITNPMIPIPIVFCAGVLLIFVSFIKAHKFPLIEVLLVICLFLLNLRPMVPSKSHMAVMTNLDFIFAIDNTISMNAEDYIGNKTRLSGVKSDVKKIVDRFPGARYSLITFDNSSRVTIPSTKDINIFYEAVDVLKPYNSYYAHGSSLNLPYQDILRTSRTSSDSKDRITVLIFISDGEIIGNSQYMEPLKSYKEIAKYIDAGAVFGYGTQTGGKMREKDILTNEEVFITDSRQYGNPPAISRIDEDNLRRIASDLKVEYINMNDPSNMNSLLDSIDHLQKNGIEEEVTDTYADLYYIFVIPTLGLLYILLFRYKEMGI